MSACISAVSIDRSDSWVALQTDLSMSSSIMMHHADLLTRFVSSEQFVTCVRDALEQMASVEDSIVTTPDGSIVLFRDANFTIVLSMERPPERFVDGFQPDTITSPIGAGLMCLVSEIENVEVTYYDLPAGLDFAVFDEDLQLPCPTVQLLERYQAFYFHPRKPFEMNAHGRSYVMATLFENRSEDFQWVFDCKSGTTLFQVSCSTEASRTETLLLLLERLTGDRIPEATAIHAFAALSHHPHHFVRWRAVQGLGELNGDLALKRLREMTTDCHPHIREAASEICEQHIGAEAAHGL